MAPYRTLRSRHEGDTRLWTRIRVLDPVAWALAHAVGAAISRRHQRRRCERRAESRPGTGRLAHRSDRSGARAWRMRAVSPPAPRHDLLRAVERNCRPHQRTGRRETEARHDHPPELRRGRGMPAESSFHRHDVTIRSASRDGCSVWSRFGRRQAPCAFLPVKLRPASCCGRGARSQYDFSFADVGLT